MNKIGLDNASYFETNATKLGEIKTQLDSQSDKDKLEGMKRLIAMISKGRDVSSCFPDVVKNVVCKNLEVKKLVYMYLTHYAELEPESVLLAINTFQKALSDQNQLIRASALRVMSSIRVLDIVQLIVLAIEKAMKDSSPYVRKAAAHAVPKVYRLDPEKKDQLIGIINSLLGDTSTMVLGSAVAAFVEVCPDHIELIHPHYRKLCRLLADVDEWGQIFILNLLIRYARSQFTCPDPALLEANGKKEKPPKEKAFYEDEDDDDKGHKDQVSVVDLDPDHRLLIKSAQPLLQSRNNGVVMAVASMYYYLAPTIEASKVGKSMVRILRQNREVQYVVLANIASMSASRPSMFEAHLSEFFVDAGDAEFTRSLKLEVLTNIANETNITRILREFKEYVKSEDKTFVTATIQAIGRCASRIEEVTSSCMQGLMALMSNPAEIVVAESVVVLKTLLQLGAREHDAETAPDSVNLLSPGGAEAAPLTSTQRRHRAIIQRLARLLDTIKVAMARASITWLVGEYATMIPTVAPDILRKLAKSFRDEQDIVKMQVLNLGAKLHLTNPDQTSSLFVYVLDLAKFDMNYDIRDRARLMRVLLLDTDKAPSLAAHGKDLLINQKPAPTISSSSDRHRFMLGSLSHIVNHSALGYQALPDFPAEAPDPSVRNPPVQEPTSPRGGEKGRKGGFDPENFYDESGSDRDSYETYSDDEDRSDRSDRDDRDDGDDRYYSDEEEKPSTKASSSNRGKGKYSDDEDSYSDRSYSDDKYSDDRYSDEYSDYSDDYDDGDQLPPTKPAPTKAAAAATKAPPANNKTSPAAPPNGSTKKTSTTPAASSKSSPSPAAAKPSSSSAAAKPSAPAKSAAPPDLDDLFGFTPSASTSSSKLTGDLTGLDLSSSSSSIGARKAVSPFSSSSSFFAPPTETARKKLLKGELGGGLEVEFSYLRRGGSIHGNHANTILLYFKNLSDRPITNIRAGRLTATAGLTIVPFAEIKELDKGKEVEQTVSITFANATQPAKFDIIHERGTYPVVLNPSIGDLVVPQDLSIQEFTDNQKKLGGMHESTEPISLSEANIPNVLRTVLTVAYLSNVQTGQDGKYRFAGKTLVGAEQGIILVAIDINAEGIGKCSVNCENTILASMLLKAIVAELIKD